MIKTLIYLIAFYISFELVLFVIKYVQIPNLPAIDQTDKTLGQGQTLKLIVTGDSAGVGKGASKTENTFAYRIAQNLSETKRIEYRNIAVSGYKTADVINHQLSDIANYKPDIIVISISGNDATHLVSSNTILSNYRTIIKKLTNETTAKIYITNIPHFDDADVLPWFYRRLLEYRSDKINKQIVSLEESRVKIINIHDFGWENFSDLKKTYAADHFHPSDLGYENWANAFLDKIRKDF
jgi:lysophospholipase L1-like esterase